MVLQRPERVAAASPSRPIVIIACGIAMVAGRESPAGVTPSYCSDVTLCVDVPASFAAGAGLVQIQAYESGRYRQDLGYYEKAFAGAGAGLDSRVHIDSMYLMTSQGIAGAASFIFSVDAPFTTSLTDSGAKVTFQPTDVIRYLPSIGKYDDTPFLAGSSIGVTDAMGANIDGLAMDKDGYLLISFDVPVTLGAIKYKPSDVIRVNLSSKALSYAFQASAAWCSGVPCPLSDRTNINGFEVIDDGNFYFTFNVPLSGTWGDFPSGTLVYYKASAGTAATWAPAWQESQSFQSGAAISDFSFRVSPGFVPNGANVPGTPLMVTKGAGNTLNLSWGHSTTKTIDPQPMDYSIYEGVIGSFTGHQPNVCSTSNAASKTITPLNPGGNQNVYFIVVPHNNDFEGSYGYAYNGVTYTQRASAASPCPCAYGSNPPMKQFVRSDP